MKKFKYIISIILIIFSVTSLTAFKFQPITMDFLDRGADATKSFHAINTTEQQIALEVAIYERNMDLDGKDILVENKKDFFVYPKQMILQPKQQQKIRVQYKGKKLNNIEKSYRIVVNQVPVNFDSNNKGGLKILFKYIGSIYIVPEVIKMNITITEIAKIGSMMKITVKNIGNSHSILKNASISLKSGDSEFKISSKDLKGFNGSNILAGSTREIVLPWPTKLSGDDIVGLLTFEEVR